MNLPAANKAPRRSGQAAFTLIEVMIAITIFFMAMFTILGVLSAELHAAGLLRDNGPTAGMIASQLSLTNKLFEGHDSGNFGEIYPDYRWESQTMEATTNGLFRIDFVVYNPKGVLDSSLSVFLYRPDSQQGHMGLQ